MDTASERLAAILAEKISANDATLADARDRKLGTAATVEALADAYMPSLRATINRNDQGVAAILRDKHLEQLAKDGLPSRPAQDNEISDIKSMVAGHVQRLNQENHVDYPMPSIVLIDGYGKTDSPAAFVSTGNLLIVDPQALPLLRKNPQKLNALIGHEMSHGNESDEQTKAVAKKAIYEKNNLPVDAQTNAVLRSRELDADVYAARTTSPTAVTGMLEDVASSHRMDYQQLIAERTTAGFNLNNESRLTPGLKQAFDRAYEKLSPSELKGLHDRALLSEEKMNADSDHPSLLSRIELQATLTAHPELLEPSTQFTIDSEANFTSVTVDGKNYTPAQISALNKEGDERVGIRTGNGNVQLEQVNETTTPTPVAPTTEQPAPAATAPAAAPTAEPHPFAAMVKGVNCPAGVKCTDTKATLTGQQESGASTTPAAAQQQAQAAKAEAAATATPR